MTLFSEMLYDPSESYLVTFNDSYGMEKESHKMEYMTKEQVQSFLDTLTPEDAFIVTTHKKDGTERTLVGNLVPSNGPQKENIPMDTIDGMRSFNINRVISIHAI